MRKKNNGVSSYNEQFSAFARTTEGFIVPDIGTYVEIKKRIIKPKVSPDKLFECETFIGIVVGVYSYQVAVHCIDEDGKPKRGENAVIYLRTQEIHMRNVRNYRKQIVQGLKEIPEPQLLCSSVNITSEDVMEYFKLIPHRIFAGYEVGDYVLCEEMPCDGRKVKRYFMRIEDKRDNIMVGTEIRYGKSNMLRYVLALQLEAGQIKIKKVPENIAFLPLSNEEMERVAL